jgi:hypothetical protein
MSGCTQICNQGRDCTCITQHKGCAGEVGNVWFSGSEPLELSVWESITIYAGSVLVALVSVAAVAALAGYAVGKLTGWLA